MMSSQGERAEHTIRAATADDAAVVAHHRVGMLRDMQMLSDAEAPMLEAASREYFAEALASNEYRGWVAELEGRVVAGGGLLVHRLLPRPGYLTGGEDAYVLNMYTEPPYRRRGLARALMQVMIEWCGAHRIARVALHASDDGRALYESLGFVQTNEMRREIKS